jgi:hypothetical protein
MEFMPMHVPQKDKTNNQKVSSSLGLRTSAHPVPRESGMKTGRSGPARRNERSALRLIQDAPAKSRG